MVVVEICDEVLTPRLAGCCSWPPRGVDGDVGEPPTRRKDDATVVGCTV